MKKFGSSKKIKFSVYSPNTLSVSQVNGAYLRNIASGSTLQCFQRRRVAGNV